ncbi:methyltransferase domain-containing protein [Streptomyces sp. NPDC017529]|uniref:methyltransferase domain-containing protein n=1 Tax=Streptomyces sp. NPDC017529 TaxID=3365000 RepID=UPI0037B7C079
MTTQRQLVETLENMGAVPAPWRQTVAAVDRGLFVPAVFEGHDFAAAPESWLRAVYADAPVVTQVNDGRPSADGAFRLFTSSSSMPSIMLDMLGLLAVAPGHRVLEIGTGTGYNAAWLCHRIGESHVTTVEVDEAVRSVAVANLKRAGFQPTAILGNGRDGWREGAPYDRIICTCSVRGIPWAWVEQCPDGRIVAPWGSSFFNGSFVTLTVAGGTAYGSFSGDPDFMWDRTQRGGAGRIADVYREGQEGTHGVTDIPPQNVIQDDPAFFIGLGVTDAWYRWCTADDGSEEATLWCVSDDGKSWATVEYVPDARTYAVEQYGPRALWDEVREQFLRWHELEKPERDGFGLTVDGDGERVWLGGPRNVVRAAP